MDERPLIGADGELIEKVKIDGDSNGNYWRPENVFLLNPAHLDLVTRRNMGSKEKLDKKSQKRYGPY